MIKRVYYEFSHDRIGIVYQKIPENVLIIVNKIFSTLINYCHFKC